MNGSCLYLLNLFQSHFNLVEYPFPDLPRPFDVKHGRIRIPLFGVYTNHVRVLDRGFGFHPANQVTWAKVACRRTEREQEQVFPVFLAEQDLDLSPVVRGDDASLLHDLRGTSDIGNDTRQFFCLIIDEHQFYTVIVAGFQFGEGGSVGVAPHFRCSVRIADAAIHTDRGSAESRGVAAFFAIVPRLNDRLSDGVCKIVKRVVRAHTVIGRYLRDIFAVSGHIPLDHF